MTTKTPRYTFGPVPSRRLGRSLGIDVVPFKTCTYDCIYCQLGRTTNKTIERREYVPTGEVLDEIRWRLKENCNPDYITLSGSGEPTLHSRLGEIIRGIKKLTDIPLAVLTNGSLLWQAEVVEQLRDADLLIPSLDAGDAELFEYINRPHDCIGFEQVVRGLMDVRNSLKTEIWLEVFLLAGVNGIEGEVRRIARIVEQIRPDRLQLNTAVRPTAEDFAMALSAEEMNRLCLLMGPAAEVIADFHETHEEGGIAEQGSSTPITRLARDGR